MNLPKQFTFVFVASIVFCTVGSVYAEWCGGPGGSWPESWPKELELLRKQASTWEWLGGKGVITTHEIPFANREEFESAWPHILKLKSKGAYLRLSNDDQDSDGGVKIFEHISAGPSCVVSRAGPSSVTRIDLEVDGSIVDLNRIRLPADTRIIDERFTENREQKKRAPQNAAEQDGAGPPAATTTTTPADEVAETPAETVATDTDKKETAAVGKPVPKKTTAAESSDSTENKPENAGPVSAALESREEESPTARPIRSLPGHGDRVTSVAYSPDGRSIGTASWDGTARLWDAKTGKEVRRLDVPSTRDHNPANLSQIMFSPDNEFIVVTQRAAPNEPGVIVWNRRTGKEVRTFLGGSNGCAAFSPDGKLIACGAIRLYDFATGKVVREMLAQQDYFESLIFSPDGKTLLSTGMPRSGGAEMAELVPLAVLRVWDVAAGKERRSDLEGLRGGARIAVSFSPDGRTLAHSQGFSTRVFLRETATEEHRLGLVGHRKWLQEFAFSPDGRTLASASDDGTVRLWDVLSGKEVGCLEGHPHWVLAVAFSPDGRTLVSGGLEKQVHVWDVSRITGRRGELKERSATELDADWRELRGDAATAYDALGRLVSSPDNAVALLGEKLQKPKPVDTKRIERLIADLDNNRFAAREQATKELGALRDLAAPALLKALAGNPSPEARRGLEALLAPLDGTSLSPETVRQIRAVQALELIGNPEARRLLEKLAAELPETRLTQEAKAATARLDLDVHLQPMPATLRRTP